MSSVSRLVGLLFAFILICMVSAQQESKRTPNLRAMHNRYIGQILDRIAANKHLVHRRFDPLSLSNQDDHTHQRKRNNAEVVNHILKNFGTLDRLGDVGK